MPNYFERVKPLLNIESDFPNAVCEGDPDCAYQSLLDPHCNFSLVLTGEGVTLDEDILLCDGISCAVLTFAASVAPPLEGIPNA